MSRRGSIIKTIGLLFFLLLCSTARQSGNVYSTVTVIKKSHHDSSIILKKKFHCFINDCLTHDAPEITPFFHNFSLKPGTFVTHNATKPLTAHLESAVGCAGSSYSSLQGRYQSARFS